LVSPTDLTKIQWIEVLGTPNYFLALVPGQHVHLDNLAGGVHRIGDYFERYSGFMRETAPNDYMIDVGANIGLSAFPVATNRRRVVAFEPVQDNISAMQNSIARNGFQNVTVVPCAVSDEVSATHIFVPSGRADNTSLGREVANANVMRPDVDRVLVNTETIDHWFEVHENEFMARNCKLFKIDVQGYETLVLQGATKFIDACRTYQKLIIEFEYDPKLTQLAGYSSVSLLELIHSYGMEINCNGTRIPANSYRDFCSATRSCDLIASFEKFEI
jgi:FkbM family methyltransferase